MPLEIRTELETKIDLELIYNKFNPFLISAAICFILSIMFLLQKKLNLFSFKIFTILLFIPIIIQILGFGIRTYITEFSPVTNMFGTMLWVSFGLNLFSILFFLIYRNYYSTAGFLFFTFLIQVLTHNIPLVLSPDMDPIVAVLRSNFWLTTHVLTITISYAAFTIAMLLGNAFLILYVLKKYNESILNYYSHLCYRAIQLGVFLLTAGIILGGIWADYSWGRFWGWDPKETWALIADLGFIILLHARAVKWITPLSLLMFSPLCYLLIIMAWFGVNFILSTGLHSYGFSSGGMIILLIFLSVQILLYFFVLLRKVKTKYI